MQEMTEIYEISFKIIVDAGDGRSKAMEAMKKSNQYQFEEAEQLVKEAESMMRIAHGSQTELMQKEARGESVEVNVILIHSQDHLTMATLAIDMAKQTIALNHKLAALEGKYEDLQQAIQLNTEG